jgi:hypothetical protein
LTDSSVPARKQEAQAGSSGLRRLWTALWRRPAVTAGLLLALPLGWLVLTLIGILVPLLAKGLRKRTLPAFEQMNEAVKERAE